VRVGDRKTGVAAPQNFTGVVWTDVVVVGDKPSRMRATMYNFNPGGRTNWAPRITGFREADAALFGLRLGFLRPGCHC
jgi:hypothetical protein